jgi:tetratricopeptide (TPR) repeat protein
MATISAPTGSTRPAEQVPALPSLRQLWQAPVFVAGLAALAVVWLARPPGCAAPVHQLERHLAGARSQLDSPNGDLDAAVQHAQAALDNVGSAPDRAGEAHFLLGSAHLRLGEHAAPELAAEHWRLAQEHLDQAERLGVAAEDGARLQYRLGKLGYLRKDDPKRVAARLAASVEQADDRAEAYSLLTRAYLSQSPPNLRGALEANKKLRQEVPQVDEKVLAPAKLLGGELLLRMNLPADARKVLEKIGEQAPPEVLTQARLLRAQTYQDEGKWKEACELWKAVLDDPRAPPPEPGKVRYNLGLCHRQLDELREAAAAWEECLRRRQGDDGPAAALALAELRLQQGGRDGKGPERSLEMLGRAVERLHGPADWANSLVELPRAREAFERMAQSYRQAGRFELAVKLCGLYTRLALPGRAAGLKAETYTEWARARHEQAKAVADPVVQQAEENGVKDLFRQAGAAHVEASSAGATPAEQAEHLWQAALGYFQGDEYAQAAALLTRFLEGNPKSERQGEGWYLLAQSARHLNNRAAAEKAFLECIAFPGRFAYRARYHLALARIEEGKTDKAEEYLTENLQAFRRAREPELDPEAYERSLFTLGSLLYKRGNYRGVVGNLEVALGRFPSNPEATRARFQLADAYRQLANQEHQSYLIRENMSAGAKEHYSQQHQVYLKKAAEQFQELEEFLQTPEARGHLTPEEQTAVPFICADCLYNLGRYEDALEMFNSLSARFAGQPPGVFALEGAARVCAARRDFPQMRQKLEEIRKALPGLPEKDRHVWEKWLADCEKPVDTPDAAHPNNGAPRGK